MPMMAMMCPMMGQMAMGGQTQGGQTPMSGGGQSGQMPIMVMMPMMCPMRGQMAMMGGKLQDRMSTQGSQMPMQGGQMPMQSGQLPMMTMNMMAENGIPSGPGLHASDADDAQA